MNDQALMSSRLGTLSALINQVLEPAFRRPCAADTPYTRKTRKHPACHCASIHRRDKGFRRDVACGHANDVRQKAAPRDANRRTRMLAARAETPATDPVIRAIRVLGARVACVGTHGRPCPPFTGDEWDGRKRRFYLDGRPVDARRLIAAANALGADIAYPGLSPRQRSAEPSPQGWA